MNDFDPGLFLAPLGAGLLVLATHVPLGRQVLARGIIFIDLAVAQIAALGVILLSVTAPDAGPLAHQGAALAAALAGAGLLAWCERRWPETQEALIGVAFVLAASAALLLLARDPHGAEAVNDLLAGQILWVSGADLVPAAGLYTGVLGLLWWRRRHPAGWAFYLPFALAVTASVQLVGVYLVFASLILPALATRRLDGMAALVRGLALGVAGYAGGLGVSWYLDLPSGPAIVWCLALCALAVGALSGRGTPP